MIQIGIDGYSGSGKGELCKGLKNHFGLKHLDTGAILRAIGLYFYRLGITEVNQDTMTKHIGDVSIKVEFENDKQKTLLNNEDVSTEIRQEKIGQMASRVAIYPEAMGILIRTSQNFASKYDCVLDGRNITSEVLPNADVKFFLTASVECRAKRRLQDDRSKGLSAHYDEVLQSLKERDYRDTHREFSAMVVVPDAIVVDNTEMSIDETINHCINLATEILKNKGKI